MRVHTFSSFFHSSLASIIQSGWTIEIAQRKASTILKNPKIIQMLYLFEKNVSVNFRTFLWHLLFILFDHQSNHIFLLSNFICHFYYRSIYTFIGIKVYFYLDQNALASTATLLGNKLTFIKAKSLLFSDEKQNYFL